MAIWSKLFTLGRAGANEAATAVVDANALRILDQEIRDADKAQGKARDDLAGLVARRRILETEDESLSFMAQPTHGPWTECTAAVMRCPHRSTSGR